MSYGSDHIQDHRRRAMWAIYGRYAAWLKAKLVRRYGAQDAEDLFQETWLRLAPYQAVGEIRHPQALLMRIATNLAADMSARRFHSTRHASEISQSHGWGCELPAQADEVLEKQLVLGLPVPLRDVFVLSRFGGLTNCSARPGTWSRC